MWLPWYTQQLLVLFMESTKDQPSVVQALQTWSIVEVGPLHSWPTGKYPFHSYPHRPAHQNLPNSLLQLITEHICTIITPT